MIAEQTLSQPGFGDVVGQQSAKRALEIAAAGGHNILMVGPPGSGKSMLARRLPALLPPLSREEAIQVSQIYTTIAPRVPDTRPDSLIIYRPFRAPHHSLSTSALVGGGRPPQPGEISLAHRGVLFLDEVPELRRDALEALRMPLEDQRVDICRAAQRVRFPADFVLVAAMNPCPCGRFGLSGGRGCRCLARDRQRYANKLSGPIRDRIDLHLWVAPVPVEQLQSPPAEDPTEQMRARVASARTLQTERYGAAGVLNARVTAERLKEHCQLDSASKKLLQAAAERFNLSARAYTRVLRVARSIADLAGAVNILPEHLAEAVRYREQPALDE